MEELKPVNGKKMIDFLEIIKKTYEKGQSDTELTLEELMEDLKEELIPLLIG